MGRKMFNVKTVDNGKYQLMYWVDEGEIQVSKSGDGEDDGYWVHKCTIPIDLLNKVLKY